MLNANMDEIEELSKRDKVVKEYEERMLTLTKDGVVINHLSYEEEEEKLRRSEIHEARDEGIAERNNEIAINLLKMNMSIKDIEKATGLSEKAINRLKKNI